MSINFPGKISKQVINIFIRVLTAAAHLPVTYPANALIEHKIIHAYDLPTYKMAPHFEDAYRFIHDCLEKGKNILVHCAAGISRVSVPLN